MNGIYCWLLAQMSYVLRYHNDEHDLKKNLYRELRLKDKKQIECGEGVAMYK